MNKLFVLMMLWMMSCLPTLAQAPMDGGVWKDNTGKHINAHGGNIFNYKGTYYWYGESRSQDGKPYSSLGVSCFTSKDLKKWTNHGLVLPVSNEAGSDIEGTNKTFGAQGTYFLGKRCTSVEKTIKNTVALLVSNLIFIYLQLLS